MSAAHWFAHRGDVGIYCCPAAPSAGRLIPPFPTLSIFLRHRQAALGCEQTHWTLATLRGLQFRDAELPDESKLDVPLIGKSE